jgi:acetyl/propionyl-CoA carboxylase alpha subunit
MALDVCAHITGTVLEDRRGARPVGCGGRAALDSGIDENGDAHLRAEAGVVEEIVVKEGQAVEEGDVLIRLAT